MSDNLKIIVDSPLESEGFCYVDVKNPPFVLGGILPPESNGNEYYRLDVNRKDEYSDDNRFLASCTSGATIRFVTDASAISLRVRLRSAILGMHHFCDRGAFGLDVYVGSGIDRKYTGGQMQTLANDPNAWTEAVNLIGEGEREVMINLPLYGGIESLEVGVVKGTAISSPAPRSVAPVAFYGSSITQGGCVSRPANGYANIICRTLDCDCVSYGFSGSALGELPVADHIASRELSCFVMDYDYNAPTVEHLEKTHEPFFKHIRALCPELPVVFVTHPFYTEFPTEDDLKRIAVVRKTYENALANGDKLVRFVDSQGFFPPTHRDLFAVDNLHPNDLGQYYMARAILPAVKSILSK